MYAMKNRKDTILSPKRVVGVSVKSSLYSVRTIHLVLVKTATGRNLLIHHCFTCPRLRLVGAIGLTAWPFFNNRGADSRRPGGAGTQKILMLY